MVNGDDCGWLCVLKEVLGVQSSMGAWYRLWWVWLERCRNGRYAILFLTMWLRSFTDTFTDFFL